MIDMIKVSIVVAVYKSEKFLPQLFDSITKQIYKNMEVILVDDGSPDNSGKICDEFAQKDDRVIVIHKKNGGACEARNTGLQYVTGKYVTIIDGDDWLEPDYISYLLNLVESTGSEMAMTDRIFTTRDRSQISDDSIEVWSAKKAASSILYPTIPIGPWNKLYSVDMLKKNGISFSVPWSGEGLYFSFMAAFHSNQVAVGHRKIYVYRLNNVNSGLTNYNVQMGINALWNIKNIKMIAGNSCDDIQNAANWHIWKNYHFLLKLILATSTKKQYHKEYKECLAGMRMLLPTIILHSQFGPKSKMKMIVKTIFPRLCAVLEIKQEKVELEKDIRNQNGEKK